MLFLRSLLFIVILTLYTILFVPFSLVISAFMGSFEERFRLLSYWSRVILWVAEKLCGITCQIEGTIPQQPCIVLSKHQSAWETLFFQTIFPAQTWVAKRELLWIPIFGWGLKTLQPIIINRKKGRQAVEQILEQGEQRLAQGRWIILFPEGTRVAPGIRKRYRMGGALLAEKTRVPVLPIAHNAGEFWPRNGFYKYPGTIRLVIGPLLDTHELTAAEIMEKTETWIETQMIDLTAERFKHP